MLSLSRLPARRRFASLQLVLLLILAVAPALGQQPSPPVFTEVGSDHRITFRFRAPNAKEVSVSIDSMRQPLPMLKEEQGVWSVTTDPLEPDYYGYSFVADGARLIDPTNPLMKPNLLNTQSMIRVPGPASVIWEVNDVPHGVVHQHFYRSTIIGDDRHYYVYTPPGYAAGKKTRYPVLYLLHGYSDDASAWTAVGRAHVILDNLIAQGKVKPMLIVMPLGYGAPEFVLPTKAPFAVFRDEKLRQRNYDRFRDALLQEVIPAVETNYRVAKDRNSRAIAGLSMGGAESLYVGLNAPERFAWIGAFSSGGLDDDFAKSFPTLDSKANSQLRLLWIACGRDDFLIAMNRKLREWLKSKDVRHTEIETAGAHSWQVWRRNLAEFTALLFR